MAVSACSNALPYEMVPDGPLLLYVTDIILNQRSFLKCLGGFTENKNETSQNVRVIQIQCYLVVKIYYKKENISQKLIPFLS